MTGVPGSDRDRAHLRDDAPSLVCSDCGRHSWSSKEGDGCGLLQPDGSRCGGTFQARRVTSRGDTATVREDDVRVVTEFLNHYAEERITHGRHCTCSACAREDWTRTDLAPCGMHGEGCPREYAPLGSPSYYPPPTRADAQKARAALARVTAQHTDTEVDDISRLDAEAEWAEIASNFEARAVAAEACVVSLEAHTQRLETAGAAVLYAYDGAATLGGLTDAIAALRAALAAAEGEHK